MSYILYNFSLWPLLPFLECEGISEVTLKKNKINKWIWKLILPINLIGIPVDFTIAIKKNSKYYLLFYVLPLRYMILQ